MPQFTKTVRFRLTVWYSSLLLVFGVAFVVALNIAVRLDQPDVVSYQSINEIEWQPVRNGPGQAISGFTPVVTPRLILQHAEDQIYSDNLLRLRNWSLLAVVGLALASGVGGYVFSGMMLRPVRDITKVASEISATNLSRRINHQGPHDELWALAQTFDSMIDRIQTSFARQRQFVQDASHELRTPLAAIRTNIEVTEMDADATPEEYRSLLDTVKSQTDRLTRLSEDLLFLSSEDGESPDHEPVAVDAISREVVHQLASLAASRNVSLEAVTAPGLEIDVNADLLYRSLSNLVDNAIKYAGEGSHVIIRTITSPATIEFEVSDNGVGIPEADLDRIFDRFYRVDRGRSRKEGGSGLGLAIVQEVVRSLGGSVGVSSKVGEGTTFSITVPRYHAAESAPNEPTIPERSV
ncbi:MAG: HAMP domain-containing sensor histidine kinase, partial [Tepidiformaceae bacterium]